MGRCKIQNFAELNFFKREVFNGKYRSIPSLYKLNLPKSNLKFEIVNKKEKPQSFFECI
jgi:hypothetical protein